MIDITLAQLPKYTVLVCTASANQVQAEAGWEISSRFSSHLRCISHPHLYISCSVHHQHSHQSHIIHHLHYSTCNHCIEKGFNIENYMLSGIYHYYTLRDHNINLCYFSWTRSKFSLWTENILLWDKLLPVYNMASTSLQKILTFIICWHYLGKYYSP